MSKSFDNGSWTSEVAEAMAAPLKPKVRAEILSYLAATRQLGATDQELEIALGRPGNTIRPSRVSLVRSGEVVDSEKWRFTVANRPAIVWVLQQFAGDAS